MGTLGIILLVLFLPAVIQGLRKGFVKQVISLVALFLGAWLAFKLAVPLAGKLDGLVKLKDAAEAGSKWMEIISFTVIFVVVVLVLSLLGNLLTKVIGMASLSWINRLLGFIFSIFKAALLIGLAIFIFDRFNAKLNLVKADTLNASNIYCYLRDFALKFFPYLQSLITKGNA